MGNEESIMAQADINIQKPALTEYLGWRLGMSVMLTGNFQIVKILGKEPGEMES